MLVGAVFLTLMLLVLRLQSQVIFVFLVHMIIHNALGHAGWICFRSSSPQDRGGAGRRRRRTATCTMRTAGTTTVCTSTGGTASQAPSIPRTVPGCNSLPGRQEVPPCPARNRRRRVAARPLRLDGRALGGAEGTKDATIARLGPQQGLAFFALVEEVAGLLWHGLVLDVATFGARQARVQHRFCHRAAFAGIEAIGLMNAQR